MATAERCPNCESFESTLAVLICGFAFDAMRSDAARLETAIYMGSRFGCSERLIKTAFFSLIATLSHEEQSTTTPEDTLREAGISGKRQAKYQRRMSSLLAGRA